MGQPVHRKTGNNEASQRIGNGNAVEYGSEPAMRAATNETGT